MTNKKLTKKVCKFEKKHPNITAACVYITGASLALRLVSTIVGGITATKTITRMSGLFFFLIFPYWNRKLKYL